MTTDILTDFFEKEAVSQITLQIQADVAKNTKSKKRKVQNKETKKDKEIFSIEPATIESANRPGNVIK